MVKITVAREGWGLAEAKGATILLFWYLYRCAANFKDPVKSLCYINEALSLLPPLKKGEIPYKYERMARVYRAGVLFGLEDYEAAYNDFRLCLIAV